MTFDNLLKVQFMQGLDQVFYARPLEHVKDAMPDCSSAAAILYISSWALERGTSSEVLQSSGTKVLMADTSASLASRPSLPTNKPLFVVRKNSIHQ